MTKKMILVFCATTALVTTSYAKQKGKPPQEAIELCLNQNEGSQCTIITPRGDELVGKCMTTPDKKYFACAPQDRPKR